MKRPVRNWELTFPKHGKHGYMSEIFEYIKDLENYTDVLERTLRNVIEYESDCYGCPYENNNNSEDYSICIHSCDDEMQLNNIIEITRKELEK